MDADRRFSGIASNGYNPDRVRGSGRCACTRLVAGSFIRSFDEISALTPRPMARPSTYESSLMLCTVSSLVGHFGFERVRLAKGDDLMTELAIGWAELYLPSAMPPADADLLGQAILR